MATEELQKAIDLKSTNKPGSIDILNSIGKQFDAFLFMYQN